MRVGFEFCGLKKGYLATALASNPQQLSTLNDTIDQMLNLGRPSLHEHIHKLGPTEWNMAERQLMRKCLKIMISIAFQDVAHLLTMMEETNNSWHLTLIRGNFKTSKLLPRLCHYGRNVLEYSVSDIWNKSQWRHRQNNLSSSKGQPHG